MISHRTRPAVLLPPLLFAVALALSGCGGSGSSGNEFRIEPPPESASTTDFTTFVGQLFSMTADDRDPQPVDEIAFEFNDQDDAGAFDDLLNDS